MIHDQLWAYHRAGFSVIPVRTDGTKAPALPSGYLDDRRQRPSGLATDQEIETWATGADATGVAAFGILCGDLSGELEFLELEGRAVREGWLPLLVQLLADSGLLDVWLQLWSGHRTVSPSGGIHLLFRISDGKANGNDRLASRPASVEEKAAAFVAGTKPSPQLIMIETRGRGGYFVAPFSISHPKPDQADPTSPTAWRLNNNGRGTWTRQSTPLNPAATSLPRVPSLTSSERDHLYDVLRMLDRMPARPDRLADIGGRERLPWEGESTGSPLDDFEARTDWSEILEPYGWVEVPGPRGKQGRYWRRPGKDAAGNGGAQGYGWSASTGTNESRDRFFVWSTSTEFATETPMTKGYVWAVLKGLAQDLTAAAAELRSLGFGRDAWADNLTIETPRPTIERKNVDNPLVPSDDVFDWCPGPGTAAHTNPFVDTDPTAAPIAPELAACYLPDEFWATRPVFGFLRAAAQAQMESPEGVLTAALAATLARTMPNIVLPACVGVEASLNLMTVAVGAAGDGKSACRKIVKEVLKFAGVDPVWEFPPSSGQGIAGQYQALRKPKGGEPFMEAIRWNALAIVEESDRIAALAAQVSNTLSSELRAAAMGELIGSGNVGDTKTNMPEGTYRFVLAMCMQPELSGWLLDEKSGGLPQRFLWTCIKDPRVVEGVPSPGTWTARLPFEATADPVSGAPRGHHVMGITDKICVEIRAAKIARKRAIGAGAAASDEYDGHIVLLRLKVAGALALLDGRLDLTDEDWSLAAHVVRTSKATIRYTQSVQADSNARKADVSRKAKVADAKAIKVAEVQTTEEKIVGDVAKAIFEKIKRNPVDGVLKSDITLSFSSGRRDYIGPALDKLVASGLVRFEKTEYRGREGSRWFLL